MYDRDSMIFNDGAGASVFQEYKNANHSGVLGYSVQSHCMDEAYYLYMGKSNFPHSDPRVRYIKMHGRKVYEYAMKYVPMAMKDCLDKSGISIDEVKKYSSTRRMKKWMKASSRHSISCMIEKKFLILSCP